MTPATKALDRSGVEYRLHTYAHDSGAAFGPEAAEKLDLPAERVFKTLVITDADGTLAIAVVPVSSSLNLKLAAVAVGSKRVTLADPKDAERATGYLVGGISPIQQKKHMRTLVEHSAGAFATIYVSGGRRGVEIELAPQDLLDVTQGRYATLV